MNKNESPFDFINVDGPYTFYRFDVEGKLQPEEHNGVHELLRDRAYVNDVADLFFEKYPERRVDVIHYDELKAFDEQEKHSLKR